MTGPFHGPMHEGTLVPDRRKGGHGALLSDLAIWPRGIQEARATAQPRKVGHIVVHTIGRSSKSKNSGYKTPAIDFAVKWYLEGAVGPHYVIDLNGTIVGIRDERRGKGHVGWSKDGVDYRKLFADPAWSAPAWWTTAWHGVAKTPLDLLPAGAKRPNDRSIGIELVPLPDATFTPEQYASLGALIADIELRYPNSLSITAVPSRGLHGHEDSSPLAAHEPHRVDGKGGKDPGAHRSTPVFHWSSVAAELAKARKAKGRVATAARATEPAREHFFWHHEHDREHEHHEHEHHEHEHHEHEHHEHEHHEHEHHEHETWRGDEHFAPDVGCEHGHERYAAEPEAFATPEPEDYGPPEPEEWAAPEPEHEAHVCTGCRAATAMEGPEPECNGECEGMHEDPRILAAETFEPEVPFADEVRGEVDERTLVENAWRAGQRRDVELTNLVFGKRHPELRGRKIPAGNTQLVQEWKTIRKKVVRPVVRDLAGGSRRRASPTSCSAPCVIALRTARSSRTRSRRTISSGPLAICRARPVQISSASPCCG